MYGKKFICKSGQLPLRNLLLIANQDYTTLSSTRLKHLSNKESLEVDMLLKEEIVHDINQAEHKTTSITFDGWCSKDKFKSKKQAIICHCTTNDNVIKSDTIALLSARVSQSADVIRRTVKTVLEKYGQDDT